MSENNPLKEIGIKINTDNIKAELQKLIDSENKIKELEAEAEKNEHKIDFYDRESGKGTIGLQNDMREKEASTRNNQKEFDSIENLIEYVRVNDKESYKKIKDKAYSAIKGNSFEWNDTFDKDGRSIIGRTLQRANEDRRRQMRE